MKELILTKIFLSEYKNYLLSQQTRTQKKINYHMVIYDNESFESTLENYVLKMMGYSVYREYILYRDKTIDNFEYFGEIRKYFENIITNAPHEKVFDMELWIEEYTNKYFQELKIHKFTRIFIEAAKERLSDNEKNVYVGKDGNKYTIGKLNQRNSENMPLIIIDNIDTFEKILIKFIYNIVDSDSFYRMPLIDFGYSEDDGIKHVLSWTLLNATALDLDFVENYYTKLNEFITDNTLDFYKKGAKKLGDLFGDELYLMFKKAPVEYETPYYLSFMLKNNRVELPNIRLGIANSSKGLVANIIATQSSQDEISKKREKELNIDFKKYLPKSKYFREYNPSHLISLVLTVGLLKSLNINIIRFTDYLPLRYQRHIIENKMSLEELNNYQHRLTNKFTNNFFRLIEVSKGIEITSYPENGNVGEIKLSNNITFENEFLRKLYTVGLKAVDNFIDYNVNNENNTKNLSLK